MTESSPLWPARLHHLRFDTAQPEAMARFYRDGLGMAPRAVEGATLLAGGERRLLIGEGRPDMPFFAFEFETQARLDAYRDHIRAKGLEIGSSPTPLFADGAFALRDPDGRTIVFGTAPAGEPDPLPGRLQHVVVASARLEEMVAFYADALGFLVSDWVRDGADATACFLRSDEEHHSLAVFRAPEARPDHHAYDAPSWNDIRDWADHFASLDVPLWWGPGRHGVGNNLFFMVEDPDGNKVELSAELEIVPADVAPRTWPHGERALNLWGTAWMRS